MPIAYQSNFIYLYFKIIKTLKKRSKWYKEGKDHKMISHRQYVLQF